MRGTLQTEVVKFLRKHGPATAKEIALGVRARRDDVDKLLTRDGFLRVPRPDGGSPRAAYWNVSRRVPATLSRRARVLLDLLSDGRRHQRGDLVASMAAAGVSTFTNNAAAELRLAGFDVRAGSDGPGTYYRLVGDVATDAGPTSGRLAAALLRADRTVADQASSRAWPPRPLPRAGGSPAGTGEGGVSDRPDEVDLRTELSAAADEALELGDQLADAVVAGPVTAPRVFCLARDFQEKRLEVRRLRRALKVEVAG